MIIPYLHYEISFSNKTFFCIGLMVLFLIIANPAFYKIVGSIIGLHNYEDHKSYHKYYLLFIHSIVYAIIIYLVLQIYNPFTSTHPHKLIHKPKLIHK